MEWDRVVTQSLLEERGHLLNFDSTLLEDIEVLPLLVELDINPLFQLLTCKLEGRFGIFSSGSGSTFLVNPILAIPLLTAGAVATTLLISIVLLLLGESFSYQ